MKDRDTLSNVQMFYAFVWTFAAMFLIGLVVTYLHYGLKLEAFLIMFVIVLAVSLAAAFFIQFVVSGFLDFGAFFFGKRSYRDLSEQLAGDVARVSYLKRNCRFEEALELTDDILVKAPNFMEVHCLRSAILWEGFHRYKEAWELLRHILQTTDRNDPNHAWAAAYYKQMNQEAGEVRGEKGED